MSTVQETVLGSMRTIDAGTGHYTDFVGPFNEGILKISSGDALTLRNYVVNEAGSLYGSYLDAAVQPNFILGCVENMDKWRGAVDGQGYLTAKGSYWFMYYVQKLAVHTDAVREVGMTQGDIIGSFLADCGRNVVALAAAAGRTIGKIAESALDIGKIVVKLIEWAPYILLGYLGVKGYQAIQRRNS